MGQARLRLRHLQPRALPRRRLALPAGAAARRGPRGRVPQAAGQPHRGVGGGARACPRQQAVAPSK
eukprot:scaffold90169_cov66-Phaeocystis_antarctica.AAC.2